MIDREAILPVCLGLIVALLAHAAAVGAYARLQRQAEGPLPAPALADLAAELRADSPVTVGQALSIEWSIRNRGRLGAGPTVATLTLGGQTIGQPLELPRLGVDEAQTGTLTHRFTSPGVHTLTLVADANRTLNEGDETNNTASVAVVVQPAADGGGAALPDLVPFNNRLPPRPLAGKPTAVTIDIANLGRADAPPFDLAVVIDDTVVGSIGVDQPLAPGAVVRTVGSVTVEQPGEHRLCIVADPADAVPEADEENNIHCITGFWAADDPTTRPGQEQPADELAINLISHEAFEQIVAAHQEAFDQPMVQMTAEPMPVDRRPIDPTDPAVPRPATPGARPAPAATPSPQTAAQQGDGQQATPRDAPSAQAPVDQPSDERPTLPPRLTVAEAEVAVAPRQADAPAEPIELEPTPRTADTPRPVTDTTEATNTIDQPRINKDPADRMTLTDPPIEVRDTGDEPTVPESIADVPRSAQVERLTPDAPPQPQADPADATQPIEGQAGDEPAEAALPIDPSPQADPAAPRVEPVEVAMAQPQLNQPEAQVDPTRPTRADDAAGAQPTPATPQSQPQPAAQPGQDARPTPAQRTDLEAPPVSRIIAATITPGGTQTIQGVQIKTVEPRFSPVARMTAVPANPVYAIQFTGEGKVIKVEQLNSTGWVNLDAPMLAALYKWKAKGNIHPEGFTIERLEIKMLRE